MLAVQPRIVAKTVVGSGAQARIVDWVTDLHVGRPSTSVQGAQAMEIISRNFKRKFVLFTYNASQFGESGSLRVRYWSAGFLWYG